MRFLRNMLRGFRRMDHILLALTSLLLAVGLVMLLSASFPSAYYETGDAAHYFKWQRWALPSCCGSAAGTTTGCGIGPARLCLLRWSFWFWCESLASV